MKFEIGDIVKCIDNSGVYETWLTVGMSYIVQHLSNSDSNSEECIGVLDNRKDLINPFAKRFVLVKRSPRPSEYDEAIAAQEAYQKASRGM